ncbi:hypothetical protein OC845_000577 [Tilletia horrida]|nr:hypothetical protein OC845_000577 [Tilletia horrida]
MDAAYTPVLLEAFEPFPRNIALHLPQDATTAEILAGIQQALLPAYADVAPNELPFYLTSSSASPNHILEPSDRPLRKASPRNAAAQMDILRLHPRLPGGKGGFGSMLRAAGGKMTANKGQNNTDSCRDLSGRRLSVMKEAKALAIYIENEPARLKALNEAQQKKYAKLERMLGRQPKAAADFEEAARRLADAEENGDEDVDDSDDNPRGEGSSTGQTRGGIGAKDSKVPTSAPNSAGVKRKERLEDQEYVEQSREIVENVRSAVASAMMKKRKKAKTGVAASPATAAVKAPAPTASAPPTATAV